MSVDVYRKVAIEALAQMEHRTPVVFALTSSHREADCRPAAEKLAAAFASVAGDAVAAFPSEVKTADAAALSVEALRAAHAVTVVPLPCLREDESAMLFAAAAGSVLLLERRGRSRSDEIDETLETVRNLGARPLGFVLE